MHCKHSMIGLTILLLFNYNEVSIIEKLVNGGIPCSNLLTLRENSYIFDKFSRKCRRVKIILSVLLSLPMTYN